MYFSKAPSSFVQYIHLSILGELTIPFMDCFQCVISSTCFACYGPIGLSYYLVQSKSKENQSTTAFKVQESWEQQPNYHICFMDVSQFSPETTALLHRMYFSSSFYIISEPTSSYVIPDNHTVQKSAHWFLSQCKFFLYYISCLLEISCL